MLNQFIIHENPDIIFNVLVDPISDLLYLEEGTDFVVFLDENSEDEILEWAENNDLIDEYKDINGSLDFDSLKALKEDSDLEEYNENPPTFATPNGRAFEWFEDLGIILPDGVQLIDGPHPGSDWQGVSVRNESCLLALQQFLFTEGYKVNFSLNSDN